MSDEVSTSRTSISSRGQSTDQLHSSRVSGHSDQPFLPASKGQLQATDSRSTPDKQPGHPGKSRKAGAWLQKACLEGHTIWDALLFNACTNIGQVLLVWPHQMSLTGITPGLILMISSGVISSWTMWLLIVLYIQRKQILMSKGQWYEDLEGTTRVSITQFHEVVGFFGARWLQYFAQLMVGISLLGVGVAQVVACASSYYSIDPTFDKRDLELIFGGCLMVFIFIPSFRHMRIFNLIGIICTGFTAWYIVAEALKAGIKPGAYSMHAQPKTRRGFFTGLATLASAGHANSMEMADTMRNSGQFTFAFAGGLGYAYFLTIPPSITANLAFPKQIGTQDNILELLPKSATKDAAVWLMIIHQFIAFALYVLPLMYMWEKAIRTHTKPWYIRLPTRVPVALLIWLIGVMFPFYATLNSFFAALTCPFIGVIIPCMVFNWHYRTQERREKCPMQPWRPLRAFNWWPIYLLNTFLSLLFLVAYTGFGVYYNIDTIVKSAHTFGVFPACYQCSG